MQKNSKLVYVQQMEHGLNRDPNTY